MNLTDDTAVIDIASLDRPDSALREVPSTWAIDSFLSPDTPPSDASPPALESNSGADARLIPVGFHPGVAAIHLAFTDHRPLVLSPDIVWMFLAQGAASHINANAEGLRRQLVEHEGTLRLEVRRDDFVRGRPGNDWPGVVEELGAQIRAHVGARTHDMFLPAFSTTGPVERMAGGIVLLDAMQQYFEYQMTTMCGIPRVFLDGTVA